MNKFYVYEWFIVDSNEIFYVGKGTGKRKTELHNRSKYFKSIHSKYICDVRIICDNLTDEEACIKEVERIAELKSIGQAKCNFTNGGTGWSSGELNPTVLNPHYGESNGMYTQNIDFKGENNPFYGKQHTIETKLKISESRKGKGGRIGSENPMYGNHLTAGEKNGMYGKTGFEHPNSKMRLVIYLDGNEEYLTSKECGKRFGIAFERIRDCDEGIISYNKKSKNSIYEGTIIRRVK